MVVFVVVVVAFGTKTALVAFFASQSKWFLKCLLWEKMRLIMGETTAMVLSPPKKTMTSYDLRQSRLVSLSRSLSFHSGVFFSVPTRENKTLSLSKEKNEKKAPRVHIIIVLGILSRIHIQKKIERERPPPLPPRDDDTKKAYRALLSKERKRKREKQRRG